MPIRFATPSHLTVYTRSHSHATFPRDYHFYQSWRPCRLQSIRVVVYKKTDIKAY